MSLDAFNELLRRAKAELSVEEQLKLINELSLQAGAKNGRRSISELRGLGKEAWTGVDADEYVRKERDSWSG